VALGSLEEEDNFCLTLILATAVMTEKITYKKRKEIGYTVD
jgi:hypothetical protein